MTARSVRELFAEFADRLEILGGAEARKASAYRRAAIAMRDWPEPIEATAAAGRLEDIPGVGPNLARKIEEFLATGRIAALDRLRGRMPPGVLSLTSVPGIGARTAGLLWREVGIDSLEALEAAARSGRLRGRAGIGPGRERQILDGLVVARGGQGWLLAEAWAIGERLAAALGATLAGEVRRACPVVGELVLVARQGESGDPADLPADLWAPDGAPAASDGGWHAILATGLPVRCRVVLPDERGISLLRETASPSHLDQLALIGTLPAQAADEAEAYGALGLPWIPPELREGAGEVDAARSGTLPRLVELADIRGDLHCHSRWSDGVETLAALAEAACNRGYDYLAVTDHSQALAVAHGLDAERLRAQRREIDDLNERFAAAGSGFRLLQGCEVEVLGDGRLDLPDAVLAELDLVIASMHSRFGQDGPTLTRRLLRVVEHPRVHLVGHPTNRRLGRREPYPVDLASVFGRAAACGTWLEVNGSAERLDLGGAEARRARAAGVRFCVDTDAHSAEGLSAMRLAVATARRGWLGPDDVWNTRPLEDLRRALAARREGDG